VGLWRSFLGLFFEFGDAKAAKKESAALRTALEKSQQDPRPLIRFIAKQLEAGEPEQRIVDKLSDGGLDRLEAEQIVSNIQLLRREARKEAGTRDIGCGLLLFFVGVVITLVTWAATAEEGGYYFIMWGAMAFGMFYVLRGLYRKVTTASHAEARLRWVLGAIVLVGGIVGGSVAIANAIGLFESLEAPPDDSFIVVDDHTAWSGSTSVTVAGTVTNTHSEWTIKDVKIEVEATDSMGKVIKTFSVLVIPNRIPPGEKGVYYQTLQVPSTCEYVQPAAVWEWEGP
jgi:hypothetical protein